MCSIMDGSTVLVRPSGATCSGLSERNDSVSRPRDGSSEPQLQSCYIGMAITKSVRDSQLPCCRRRPGLKVGLDLTWVVDSRRGWGTELSKSSSKFSVTSLYEMSII